MREANRLGAGVRAAVIGLGLALAGPGPAARADGFSERGRWLPRLDSLAAALTTRPREVLAKGARAGAAGDWVELGAVLFRAPAVLGLEARRIGMSCATCHTGGDANRGFFLAGLSNKARTFDPTTRVFNRRADDGKFNPIRIPSLRGVRATAPYGHRGRFPTLAAFTRHVVVDEFDGAVPPPKAMRALVAYLRALKPAPNRLLGPGGRLTGAAPAAARRGEMLFRRPFKGYRQGCAACHRPARRFTDGKRHDVGTGGAVDTPTLRGIALGGPYLHDGRFETLETVLAHFERRFALDLTAAQRAELIAYLRAVGAADRPTERVTLAADLALVARAERVLATLLDRKDAALAGFVIPVLRRDLGRIHDRFPHAEHARARAVLVGWSRALQRVRRRAEAGDFGAARVALVRLWAGRARRTAVLRAAAPSSLYDPVRLEAFLKARRGKR